MNRRMGKRKLTRVILAALMATGGFWGSSAEAVTAQVTPVIRNDSMPGIPALFNLSGTSQDTEGNTINSDDYVFGNIVDLTGAGHSAIYKNSTYQSTSTKAPDWIFSNWTNQASGFTTTMTGGTLGNLYGGYSKTQDASNNTVNISGNSTLVMVEGGKSQRGNADGNTVTIDGGTISIIRGGNSNEGTVTNNRVTVNNGTIAEGGGYFVGGLGQKGAYSNHVTINGGTIGEISGGIAGGWAVDGSAENNDVTITGGTIGKDAYGESVAGGFSNSSTGTATGNTVSISGDTTNIAGNVYGGRASNGNATGNTVTIEGGAIGGTIYGGYTNPNSSTVGTVSDNTVTINKEGISLEYIYGGSSMNHSFGNGTATGNTVNILAAMTAKGIYGGIVGDGGTSSGNTLNVAAKGITVTEDGIGGFQNLNFYLPTDMTTSDTMLTVNGTAYVTDAKVGVKAQGKLSNLTTNDKVTLLHANTLTGYDTVTQTTEITVPTGLTTVDSYEFSVTSDPNNIYATITKDSSNNDDNNNNNNSSSGGSATADAQKSVVETRAAAVTLLNAGADMLASQGFAQAANAVALEAVEQAKNAEPGVAAPVANAFTPFAAFGGSSMRAESGSHVDTKGFGINVGFAKEFSNSQGKLLFGPVVEYGGGNYDSYNNDVHGDGKSHYWGIGLMARQVNHDGFYYEGSVRGGRVTSDYSANFANNAGGTTHARYDSSSNYWAAHVGLGKVFAAGKKGTVDGYLKYFYSHQAGDDTDIRLATATGEGTQHVSFDSVDSHRVRVGARYTHKVNEMNSFYGGLAYQYEFGGEARAHYGGVGEAPSPSVKGSSGMLELGWQVKPGGPVTIDLGVTGWAGKQRGGSVQLGATWTF